MNMQNLAASLTRIDGKQYPFYKDIKGTYQFDIFTLSIDHVQGDPFAAPSRLSIKIPHSESKLPPELFSNRSRKTGTETYLAKAFSQACQKAQRNSGSGKSGLISIDSPEQEVLQRTSLQIENDYTIVRFSLGLPANGRRILGRTAAVILSEDIPEIVENALVYQNLDALRIRDFANCNEDADALRASLKDQDLVAFIADGSTLPRSSGIDQRPLQGAIPFESPASMRHCVSLPNAGEIHGMGIKKGITIIVGGGYHGKSTLLNAIERGVYNHIPGDGREKVVSRSDATKVRAEDGRAIPEIDLSYFINNLPGGKPTKKFTTPNASGSTSQAASTLEAIESGSKLLLIDEDISATNFLIRDQRMMQLIAPEKEPITPFSQRIESLYKDYNLSTILILGGSSAYFEAAHKVIALDNYIPRDLTLEAKALCSIESPQKTTATETHKLDSLSRYLIPSSISPFKKTSAYRGNRGRPNQGTRPARKNIKTQGTQTLVFGAEEIDLSLIAQIVSPSQVRTIGAALDYALEEYKFEDQAAIEVLQHIILEIEEHGLSILKGQDLAEIRVQELAGALYRLRSTKIRS